MTSQRLEEIHQRYKACMELLLDDDAQDQLKDQVYDLLNDVRSLYSEVVSFERNPNRQLVDFGECGNIASYRNPKVGSFVGVRPVGEEYEGKTYLGIYLGDLALSCGVEQREGVIYPKFTSHNPAIWTPDLKRIVFGYESFWGVIESPEDLRQITDEDIQNVWYLKVLHALSSDGSNEATSKSESS